MRWLALTSCLCLVACGASSTSSPRAETTPSAPTEATVPSEWTAWRETRREALAGEDGWLTLIALAWLEPGETTIGSDPGSGIVLPADRAPAHVGRFVVGDDVRFVAEAGVDITSEGAPATDVVLYADLSGEPTRLALGTLRMHVIERAGRLGLRVKDQASPAREGFTGIQVYDYDPRYRARARVAAPDPPRSLSVVNVLGMQADEPLVGIVSFEIDGTAVSLAAIAAGSTADEGLFVMLRDATAGAGETYPAGRYLDVAEPDANGETWVDLNYLYTPPCSYTELATCPLPPEENVLAIPIRAGERYARAE